MWWEGNHCRKSTRWWSVDGSASHLGSRPVRLLLRPVPKQLAPPPWVLDS
jgi:hypothetical protein